LTLKKKLLVDAKREKKKLQAEPEVKEENPSDLQQKLPR
jgi:hypothetical protein